MTLEQGLAFALLGTAVVLFVWGRWRYDLVALGALLAGVLLGVIPAKEAFSGFSNDVVVIIACALIVSAAVSKSGLTEIVMRRLTPRLKTAQVQVPVLVGAVTFLSMVTKNVGALAILMPVAMQLSRKTGTSPSCLLMPMSFASLMGGLATLVGTSPNILVSEVRERTTGEPFGMFDYTPVGLTLALAGALFLSVAYRLLPAGRKGTVGMDAALEASTYTTEAVVSRRAKPTTVSELQGKAQGEVKVASILRGGDRQALPLPDASILPGDVLMLRGEPEELERLIKRARLKHDREDRPAEAPAAEDEVRSMEAVVGRDSLLIGRTPAELDLFDRWGVNVIAVSRHGERTTGRLRDLAFCPGDLLVLQGSTQAMPEVLRELGCLPLAERDISLGRKRRVLVPALVLAAAITLVAMEVLPVAIAFFAAAVAMVALKSISMRDAYDSLDGPVLVLVAALIPVSDALRATGGTELMAGWLSVLIHGLPAMAALAVVMVAAMAVTPFLNNAATVLVLGPIGVSLAQRLGLSPDPFLMAVAIGAACDFLTPIGHQCNTLVMGPGGYRFGDYWRLGAPLSVMVVALGVPLIAWFWPVAPV